MNKTKIEWADYTWNPVVGCQHGCIYCYAEGMNKRFKFIKNWNKPEFFPQRLTKPEGIKKPSIIFVGSMCDLFGSWIPDEWINKIIECCKKNMHHTFMFLTKNPVRYTYFDFPENCWLGSSITNGENYRIQDMYELSLEKANFTFLSIEPILGGNFYENLFITFDLLIVGAMTGNHPVIPEKEWMTGINHKNIFYKNNILNHFPNLPKGSKNQILNLKYKDKFPY